LGYGSYSFLTSTLDGSEWLASFPGRALIRWKEPPLPTGQEARFALEAVWMQRLEEKSSASSGNEPPVIQSVFRHYTMILIL
jgi:hypothetical protein